MSYCIDKKSDIMDKIGITIGAVYLFFMHLGSSVFFPSIVNRFTLLVFLGYGAVNVLVKIIYGAFHLSRYSLWYLLFIGFCIISVSYSEYPGEITSNHMYQMVVCLVISTLLIDMLKTEKDFCVICWTFVISSFAMLLLLFATGNMVGDANERLGNDISGNANVFASFMMYSTMLCLWLLLFQNYRLIIKGFLLLSIVGNYYALMLSGGRKFFLMPMFFLLLLFISKSRNNEYSNAFQYIMITGFIAVIGYLLIMRVPLLYNAIGIRMEGLFNAITGNGMADSSTVIRSEMRKAAINYWTKKPILGYGFDTFKHLRTSDLLNGGAHGYSHCNYTELLYNGGIVAFLLYYSIFAIIFFEARIKKGSNVGFAAFSVATVLTQFVLDYGGIFYDDITTHMFIMLSVWCLEYLNKPPQEALVKSQQHVGFASKYIKS